MRSVICETQDELAIVVAELWCRWFNDVQERPQPFSVALAGGSTPRSLYQQLATEPYRQRLNWDRHRLFFGDERSVAPDHEQSNYRMAKDALLDPVHIAPTHVFRMQADSPDIDQAAREYQSLLEKNVPLHDGIPQLDLVLLGMGDDGHTASLFPDTGVLKETQRLVAPVYVEKLNTWRMTLTYPVINNASHVVIMVCGENKAERIRDIFQDQSSEVYPIQGVKPQGELYWCLDMAAARYL